LHSRLSVLFFPRIRRARERAIHARERERERERESSDHEVSS
jgi:hypothetical protein